MSYGSGVACFYVDMARKLAKMPEVAAAFANGEVSLRHVQVLAAAYTTERAPLLSHAEPELVAAARDHSPNELGTIVRSATDAIDGDGGATRDEDDFDARALYASKTLHGRGDMHSIVSASLSISTVLSSIVLRAS